MLKAKGSNAHFVCTVQTVASPEKVWALWTDVTTWALWDGGLKSATLEGDFDMGAKGKVFPHRGRPVGFVVIQSQPKTSNSFVTQLPLAKLVIERSLVAAPEGGTQFTHRVSFIGPLSWVWAQILGAGFRKELPKTMARLAKEAEALP